ncbi:hypothetical protein Efla_000499 [Eimeria flavescens]
MKAGEASPSLSGVSLEEAEKQMGRSKQAYVPVVVLGATVGGLAAAVAIRSRTGRAVCVIDVDGKESEAKLEGKKNKLSVLSARSLDALRAINADLHRSVLASAAGDGSSANSPVYDFDVPLRLPSPLLREILVDHLTAGVGGSSSIWRSSGLKGMTLLAREEDEEAAEGAQEVLIAFEDGVTIKGALVIVATDKFPFLPQTENPMCVEGVTSLPKGVSDGLWLVRGDSDSQSPGVALLSETQKQAVTFMASSPSSGFACIAAAAETTFVPPASGKHILLCWFQTELITQNAALLSAVMEEVRKTPAIFKCHSTLQGPESSWTFWGGSLILTGAAAHPWASSCGEGLELDLEDAAQLACSLYDWKFALRLASDRFEAIRKRRLSSFPSSPRTTASPESFSQEDQMFVPTRDAYAALLPAVELGYEVQEAGLY